MTHLHWTNIVKDSRDVRKSFLGIFCRECLRYLPSFLRNMQGVCVKLVHSGWGDREYIFITTLIIIIKAEISIFPIVVIFPWLFAWVGCTIIDCHIHVSPGKAGFCVFYCAVLWCAQIIEYIVTRRLYAFVCTSYHSIIIMHTYLKYCTS